MFSILEYIGNKDEKKYISSIISELFNENEEILWDKTAEVISQCHLYLRKRFGNFVVSLREMLRFKNYCKFFIESYYPKKRKLQIKKQNKEVEKLKSIIISINQLLLRILGKYFISLFNHLN